MLTQHIMQQVAITSSTFDNRDIWSGVETFIIKNNIWNNQGLHHTIPQTFTQRHLKWGEDNNYNNGSHFLPFTGPYQKKVGGTKRKLPPPSRYFFTSCTSTVSENYLQVLKDLSKFSLFYQRTTPLRRRAAPPLSANATPARWSWTSSEQGDHCNGLYLWRGSNPLMEIISLSERPKSRIGFRKSVILGRKLGLKGFRLGGFPSNSGSNSFMKMTSDHRIT